MQNFYGENDKERGFTTRCKPLIRIKIRMAWLEQLGIQSTKYLKCERQSDGKGKASFATG